MSKDEQDSSAVQHELDTARRKYQELLLESQTMRAKVSAYVPSCVSPDLTSIIFQVICLDSEKNEAQKEVKGLKEALVAQKRDLNFIQEHPHTTTGTGITDCQVCNLCSPEECKLVLFHIFF